MKLIDWHLTSSRKGSFTLFFETSEGDEDKIRYLLNNQIEALQENLKELEDS